MTAEHPTNYYRRGPIVRLVADRIVNCQPVIAATVPSVRVERGGVGESPFVLLDGDRLTGFDCYVEAATAFVAKVGKAKAHKAAR